MNSHVVFVVTAIVMLSSVYGCATTDLDGAVKSQADLEIRIYEVFGMDCPGCHGGLNKLVEKIPAVEQSTADWKAKKLTVTVKRGAQLNDEEVYGAIRRANFTPGKRIK